jgi:hypothetical protein
MMCNWELVWNGLMLLLMLAGSQVAVEAADVWVVRAVRVSEMLFVGLTFMMISGGFMSSAATMGLLALWWEVLGNLVENEHLKKEMQAQ